MKAYLPNYLKEKNRKLVFDLFREKRALTCPEIVDQLGMSFPTAIKSVNRLLELGMVQEAEEKQPSAGAGRRGRKLLFRPESFLAGAVMFEGRYASIGLVDMDGNVSVRKSVALPPLSPKADLQEAADTLRGMLAGVPAKKILGIGIGFPALIDPETSEILRLDSAEIRRPVPFCERFPCFRIGKNLSIYLDNDVNTACAGEAFLRGNAQACGDLFYLSLGTGLGGAIRMDGRIRRGNGFRAGEIGGLLRAAGENRTERLEQEVNLSAIASRFHINLGEGETPSPETCHSICAYLAPRLGLLLYNLSCVLDISRYVLAGIIPKALGEEIFREIRAELGRIPTAGPAPTVEPSVSEDAGLVGAAMQVFERRVADLVRG